MKVAAQFCTPVTGKLQDRGHEEGGGIGNFAMGVEVLAYLTKAM